MRFHCGISFRPKKLKWLLIGVGLLGLLFSNIMIVHADYFSDAPNMYYYRDNATSEIFPNVLTSSSDYYYYPTNSGFNAYNFTTIYYFNQSASNVICPSGFADVSTRVSLLDTTGNYINDGLNFTEVNNGTIQLASIQNGYADVTFKNVDLSKNLKFVTNASYGRQTQVGIFAVHKPLTITCLTADWQYIVNNNNENTETIVNAIDGIDDKVDEINDTLTDDNVSEATSNAEDLFDDTDVSEPIGLTSIITAPIRLLQTMLDGGTCNDFTFSINMNGTPKQVSIPSGCLLWNNVPSAVVFTYHVMVFGLLGYRVLIDMVHFVNSLRDPDKKNDYTLDL